MYFQMKQLFWTFVMMFAVKQHGILRRVLQNQMQTSYDSEHANAGYKSKAFNGHLHCAQHGVWDAIVIIDLTAMTILNKHHLSVR